MKYRDIKKYTSVGHYQVNTDWSYLPQWIKSQSEKIIPGAGLELCPDFQRGHVWAEDQQIAYVEYALRGGKSGIILYFNCSSWRGSFNTPLQLVDGLQRVTAVTRFLNNEIKAFGAYLYEYEDKDILLRSTEFLININNLKTRAEVLEWYIELNEGGVIHTKEEIDRVRGLLENEMKGEN